MKVILLFGIAGWGMMLLTCFFWDMESRGLEKKLASAEIEAQLWKERCDATVDAVEARERAIAHLVMQVEGLTPKRIRGKFAKKAL